MAWDSHGWDRSGHLGMEKMKRFARMPLLLAMITILIAALENHEVNMFQSNAGREEDRGCQVVQAPLS